MRPREREDKGAERKNLRTAVGLKDMVWPEKHFAGVQINNFEPFSELVVHARRDRAQKDVKTGVFIEASEKRADLALWS